MWEKRLSLMGQSYKICHKALAQFPSFPECIAPPAIWTRDDSRRRKVEKRSSSSRFKILGSTGSEQRDVQSVVELLKCAIMISGGFTWLITDAHRRSRDETTDTRRRTTTDMSNVSKRSDSEQSTGVNLSTALTQHAESKVNTPQGKWALWLNANYDRYKQQY